MPGIQIDLPDGSTVTLLSPAVGDEVTVRTRLGCAAAAYPVLGDPGA